MFFLQRLHIVGSVALGIAFLQVRVAFLLPNETFFLIVASLAAIWTNCLYAPVLHDKTHEKIRHLQILLTPS